MNRLDVQVIADTAGSRRVVIYQRCSGTFGFEEQYFLNGPAEFRWLLSPERSREAFATALDVRRALRSRVSWLANPRAFVAIGPDDPSSNAGRDLIGRLDAHLIGLYPAESNHLVPVEALCQPGVTFLLARVGGQPAGCGAFLQQGDYAEIKRMFVAPDFRGLGLARFILEELERKINATGLRVARLETGCRQREALRLYEAAGYERRGPFGDYGPDPLSVFMEKRL